MAFLESRRNEERLTLVLRAEWRAAFIAPIRAEVAALDLAGVLEADIDCAGAQRLDLAGAWALDDLTRQLAAHSIAVQFTGGEPQALQLVRSALHADPAAKPSALREDTLENPVELLGRTAVERLEDLRAGLSFVGHAATVFMRALGSWRRLRPISVARHVYDTGITAIPIVSLIAFLISVIIAYLSASQLRNYGADIYVVDLITVGVLRELGVLLTAIIVAGRTGSAFAAEIGSMQLNEEVDALDSIGVDAVETLVLPRVLGLVIALPLLTFIADLIGLAGGALLCQSLLDMPLQQFVSRANEAIAPTTFWAGIIKAPVFAVLIAMAGTYRGLQVRGSSRELGRLTTVAVVQAIFMVLLADALFAVFYMKIDFWMAAEEDVVVEVRGVVNRFGRQLVHDGLDMQVRRGEVFGILGGSGSGKSVLLRTILGLRRPQAGSVRVEGIDITQQAGESLRQAKANYGVTFQHGALFSALTVRENIQLPMIEHLRLPRDAMDELAQLKLRLVGLPEDAADKYPSQLSGGMVKRAALARSLALDPQLLFLDEPTSGLDPISAAAFDDLIAYLQQELHLTVVMITHDLDTIFRICGRVGVIVDRRMVQDTRERIVDHPHPWIQAYFHGTRAARFAAEEAHTHGT